MSNYSAVVLADTPFLYYRLNDASGGPADSSGSARNAGMTGTPTYSVTGALISDSDKAITYSGTGQYSTWTVDASYTGDYTMELWLKAVSFSAYPGLIGSWSANSSGNYGAGMDINTTGSIDVNLPQSDFTFWRVNANEVTTMSTGTWYHIVLVVDSVNKVWRLYKNGSQVGTDTSFVTNIGLWNAGHVFRFASSGGGNAALFNGTLDEVAVYKSALSATRVLAHYTAGTVIPGGSPPAGAVTYTGQVPVLAVPTILPPAGAVAYTGLIPTVTGTANETPPTGAIAYAGLLPAGFGGSAVVGPPTGAVTYAGFAPTPVVTATPPAGTHTYAGLAPTLLIYSLENQCDFTNGTAYPWHNISGWTYTNPGTRFTPPSTVTIPGGWGVDAWPGQVSSVLNITIPTGFPSPPTVSVSYTFNNGSYISIMLVDDTWNNQTNTGVIWSAPTYFGFNTVGTTYTATMPTLTQGQTYHLIVTAQPPDSSHDGITTINEVCIQGLFVAVNNTITGIPIAATTTYTGRAPAAITIGPTPNAATGTINYRGFNPSLLINGALIIPAPIGAFTLMGQGPAILGTTATQNIPVIPGNIQFNTFIPNIIPAFHPSQFIFIDESYIGYTALDAVPLSTLEIGSLLHGQTKIARFRIGNTSGLLSTFTISSAGVNSILRDAILFSYDNYTWAPSLTFVDVPNNAVSDVIFMKLVVPDSAPIGTGTFLVNVDQQYV